jgi:hypothetical protein
LREQHNEGMKLILHRLDEIIASDLLIVHHLDRLLHDPRTDEAAKANIGRWLELRR